MGIAIEQQGDFFGAEKRRAEGATKAIEEKERFGKYFDAAKMCEEYGHADRAFRNYKQSADQERDSARAMYAAVEKDPANNSAVLQNLADATRSYDIAALSCEGALRTLPKDMRTDEMRNKVRRGAFNMWRMKGDLQSKIMDHTYKFYTQKIEQLKKYPAEQQQHLRERSARELDSINQKCLQTAIVAFSSALDYCDDQDAREKLKGRIAQREQMLNESFERSLTSEAA